MSTIRIIGHSTQEVVMDVSVFEETQVRDWDSHRITKRNILATDHCSRIVGAVVTLNGGLLGTYAPENIETGHNNTIDRVMLIRNSGGADISASRQFVRTYEN